MAPPSGFTTVTGSHFTDATGADIAYVIFFQPALSSGVPTSFHSGGTSAGQVSKEPVSIAVAAGSPFSINLADVSLTVPQFIGYNVWAIDAVSSKPLLSPGYFIQPTGSAFNFDTYVAGTPATPTGASGGGGGGTGITLTPGLLIDVITSQYYALGEASGSLTVTPVASTGTPATGIELIDTATSIHYTLYSSNGSLMTEPTPSPGTGVPSYSFVDSVTSASHVLTITNNSINVT